MPQIILEGREFNAKPLSPADRCRYIRQVERLKRAVDFHAIELLLMFCGVSDPPQVTEANADSITATLAALISPKPKTFEGQAAVDELRRVNDGET